MPDERDNLVQLRFVIQNKLISFELRELFTKYKKVELDTNTAYLNTHKKFNYVKDMTKGLKTNKRKYNDNSAIKITYVICPISLYLKP